MILSYFQQKANTKFPENSRKLYFGSILDPFSLFHGKQEFFYKIHFCHFFYFSAFLSLRKLSKRFSEHIPREIGPVDGFKTYGQVDGITYPYIQPNRPYAQYENGPSEKKKLQM